MATRINKYLSEIGHCSRRGADKLLEQGRITINGKVPELGEKVQEGDVVAVDGIVWSTQETRLHRVTSLEELFALQTAE